MDATELADVWRRAAEEYVEPSLLPGVFRELGLPQACLRLTAEASWRLARDWAESYGREAAVAQALAAYLEHGPPALDVLIGEAVLELLKGAGGRDVCPDLLGRLRCALEQRAGLRST
jgi:hypothetical protein